MGWGRPLPLKEREDVQVKPCVKERLVMTVKCEGPAAAMVTDISRLFNWLLKSSKLFKKDGGKMLFASCYLYLKLSFLPHCVLQSWRVICVGGKRRTLHRLHTYFPMI